MAEKKNLVVVHYLDGRLAKGYISDFNQNNDTFQLRDKDDGLPEIQVNLDELKAVFFVKSLEGDPDYRDPIFPEEKIRQMVGLKLKIVFRDGEIIYATSQGYSPARKGFYIFPLDPDSNNKGIYVNNASTVSVEVIR